MSPKTPVAIESRKDTLRVAIDSYSQKGWELVAVDWDKVQAVLVQRKRSKGLIAGSALLGVLTFGGVFLAVPAALAKFKHKLVLTVDEKGKLHVEK